MSSVTRSGPSAGHADRLEPDPVHTGDAPECDEHLVGLDRRAVVELDLDLIRARDPDGGALEAHVHATLLAALRAPAPTRTAPLAR